MLYTKDQVLMLVRGIEKMPTKNKYVIVCDTFNTKVVYWYDGKSPEGKRLYNVGNYREDGTQPPLFRW